MRQTKAIMKFFRSKGKPFHYCRRRFGEVLSWDGKGKVSDKADRILWKEYKKDKENI